MRVYLVFTVANIIYNYSSIFWSSAAFNSISISWLVFLFYLLYVSNSDLEPSKVSNFYYYSNDLSLLKVLWYSLNYSNVSSNFSFYVLIESNDGINSGRIF